MYWESFGFKEPPFALTPNPAFLFLSSAHQEAFAHLLFAIENRAGFIELSGEVGTGKTTIIRTLLSQLDPEIYRTALIFNPTISPLGLFREISSEFGLPFSGTDLQELHQGLNAFLLEENRQDRTVVLVIDEAQNLATEVLEHLRLISNLETERSKLIQIVLVGQPELRTLLGREELRQLDQRITVRYHLKPMSFQDSCDYIRHRIRFASGGGEPLSFSAGALKRIFKFSGGLPRLINSSCDRTLLLAYTKETREITSSMAAESITELSSNAPLKKTGVWPKFLAALVVLALLFTGWWTLSGRGPAQAAKVAVSGPGSAERPASAGQSDLAAKATPAERELAPFSVQAALRELGAASEEENLRSAINAVLGAWHTQQFVKEPLTGLGVSGLALQRGLTATPVEGGLDALAHLDAPALLQVSVPGAGNRLVALIGLDREQARIAPALAGRRSLTRGELAQIWKGGATVLWKDFHGIGNRVKPAERAAGVRQLQGLLKGAGCYPWAANGLTGPKLTKAITEFQRKEGLPQDGKAKGLTLLLLYRRAGGFFPPALGSGGAEAGDHAEGGMKPGVSA